VVQVLTLRRRSWASLPWLIVIVAALLTMLAFGNSPALLAALAAALFSGWLLLRGSALALAPSQPVAVNGVVMPYAQRGVVAADGSARQALVIPAAAVDGYQTVLTIDGYVLVNAEGRVVYALSRESHASASEPVVVTIVDAEVAVH
jgi:hypothetical protein